MLRVAVREKRSGEDRVCVEKAHEAVAESGKPHETRVAERQSTECVWRKRTWLSLCLGSPHEIRVAERQSTSVCGVLGESREVHVYERCTCTRRTYSRGARPELGAVVLWSTRSREVATPFFFFYLGYV